MLHFTIPGTLPGLNEYVKANRTHVRTGSQMSKGAFKYIDGDRAQQKLFDEENKSA